MDTFFCQHCGENPANLWVTKIMEDHVSKHHLCDECFRKLSGYAFAGQANAIPFSMALPINMINPLISLTESIKPAKAAKFQVCGNCSTSWSDFLQTGFLGCAQCYESFSKFLQPIIKDIHSSTEYKGKIPGRLPDNIRIQASLIKLKQKLFKSIDKENYEQAAKIRDEMKDLKEQLNKVSQDAK